MSQGLFQIGKEDFTVTACYDRPVASGWNELLKRMHWWGGIALKEIRTCFTHGTYEAVLYYVVLLREDYLWEWPREFDREGIIPADAVHLFAFGLRYLKEEVSPAKRTPIVVLAPGSIWRCSHDILIEAPGLVWDGFYHAPGPKLHTESAPFQKGTRILAVRE